MKKILSLILVCVMAISLTACGGSVAPNSVFSVDDLAGKKIGVQLGTTGDTYASDYEEEGSVVERYNEGAEAVMALKQGKVDCVIIDEQPAKAYIKNSDDLTILEEPFADEDYAMAIALDNTALLDEFNTALAELKADGTLQTIIDNYIGDNAGKNPYTTPDGTDTSKGELVMATNATFPPYEYYEGEKIVGIDVDIAQAICDKLGYKLVVEDMKFDSIIPAVQQGKADFGAAGMTVTEDRLKNVNFTDSYVKSKQVIIVRNK